MPSLRRSFFTALGLFVFAGSARSEISLRIARFAGDRAAAISYTFDDGIRDQYTVGVPMLNELGFSGTFFVIPGRVSADVADAERRKYDKRAWGTITWSELKMMADQGHEVASHSWSHTGFGKLTQAQGEDEMIKSRDVIKEHIGSAPLTFAFPFNQASPENKKTALKHFVAFRSHQLGVGGDKTTVGSLNTWADQQVLDKAWGVVMIHGISYGYSAFTSPEILRAHLRYVKNRAADIWVDTFANIALYEKERDDGTLAISSSFSNRITFVLTSKLDPARYKVPLTIVFDIPNTNSASAVRAGHELPVRLFASSFQLDAIPSSDPITVSWK